MPPPPPTQGRSVGLGCPLDTKLHAGEASCPTRRRIVIPPLCLVCRVVVSKWRRGLCVEGRARGASERARSRVRASEKLRGERFGNLGGRQRAVPPRGARRGLRELKGGDGEHRRRRRRGEERKVALPLLVGLGGMAVVQALTHESSQITRQPCGRHHSGELAITRQACNNVSFVRGLQRLHIHESSPSR